MRGAADLPGTTGGSSGGSAAAGAAGVVPLARGSIGTITGFERAEPLGALSRSDSFSPYIALWNTRNSRRLVRGSRSSFRWPWAARPGNNLASSFLPTTGDTRPAAALVSLQSPNYGGAPDTPLPLDQRQSIIAEREMGTLGLDAGGIGVRSERSGG